MFRPTDRFVSGGFLCYVEVDPGAVERRFGPGEETEPGKGYGPLWAFEDRETGELFSFYTRHGVARVGGSSGAVRFVEWLEREVRPA